MSRVPSGQQKAVPAQIGFLAIYNPSLGTTDSTLKDQIVYYWSPETAKETGESKSPDQNDKEEENERLRHVGLAQGMVEFARTFSNGDPVDTIDTEKSRIVLTEIEEGWWILASVDLTRLPKATTNSSSKTPSDDTEDAFEYSSREVKCPYLLLQDLRRAHSTFLLHHATSLNVFFRQHRKSRSKSILSHYWDTFMSSWTVMLHGNPAASVFGGIRTAASGELGIGVGEEERGSGEREVLEGFVDRIEGLVDLVVSRFGDAGDVFDDRRASKHSTPPKKGPHQPWLGSGHAPSHTDGPVFLGVGALSRTSLEEVTNWMEDVYCWGPRAYGIMGNQTVSSKRSQIHEGKPTSSVATSATVADGENRHDCSPIGSLNKPSPDRVKRGEKVVELHEKGKFHLRPVSPHPATPDTPGSAAAGAPEDGEGTKTVASQPAQASSQDGGASSYLDYFKLGYGKHWSLTGGTSRDTKGEMPDGAKPAIGPAFTIPRPLVPPSRGAPKSPLNELDKLLYPEDDSIGHYLIGLLGDIEETDEPTDSTDEATSKSDSSRITKRTVAVELDDRSDTVECGSHLVSERLSIVLYCERPFVYALLFRADTKALSSGTLYRSLHYQLSPLQRPLLSSTNHALRRPSVSLTSASDGRSPIYDLIWDPKQRTVSTTIPNIPIHGSENYSTWSRLEALNTHMQILGVYSATRDDSEGFERTCKTSRNYWIVCTRLPDPEGQKGFELGSRSGSATPTDSEARPGTADSDLSHHVERSRKVPRLMEREVWLVRKAGDGRAAEKQGLARGIGVDTRVYIDELLQRMQ